MMCIQIPVWPNKRSNENEEMFMNVKDVARFFKVGEHDMQLNSIYDAIENLLDEKAAQRKWNERDRIGFKNR